MSDRVCVREREREGEGEEREMLDVGERGRERDRILHEPQRLASCLRNDGCGFSLADCLGLACLI